MTEPLTDSSEAHPVIDQFGGMGMAELMEGIGEPDRPAKARRKSWGVNLQAAVVAAFTLMRQLP